MVNAVSLGCSENQSALEGHWWIFYLSCLLFIKHQTPRFQLQMLGRPFKRWYPEKSQNRGAPLLHCLLITHSTCSMCPHKCCTSTHSLTASPWSGLFLSMRLTQETIFYLCPPIMLYSFRKGDQCMTQALSQQKENAVETAKEWVFTSCGVHWPFLPVPLSTIGSWTLIWTERKRGTDYGCVCLKSFFVEPIIGSLA